MCCFVCLCRLACALIFAGTSARCLFHFFTLSSEQRPFRGLQESVMITRATLLYCCLFILVVVGGARESSAFATVDGGGGLLQGSIRPLVAANIQNHRSNKKCQQRVTCGVRSAPTDDESDDVDQRSSAVMDQFNANEVLTNISSELQEISACFALAYNYLTKPNNDVSVEDVVRSCDAIDSITTSTSNPSSHGETSTILLTEKLMLRKRVHEYGRYQLFVKLMKVDYHAYVTMAEFLCPTRVLREELPNIQDVNFNDRITKAASAPDDIVNVVSAPSSSPSSSNVIVGEAGVVDNTMPLVPDCELKDLSYTDSLLDKLLLYIFRTFVAEYTGLSRQDDMPGIKGLLAQGREYMILGTPPTTQHDMVKSTLGKLMTPILPPFYRIFMSGIVPKLNTKYDGKQIGPWPYAPYLTSIVTPIFFGFLVGPSRPNRRKDGTRGGLIVEKCKFLQESKCKGLCLHQCKLPAQEFFAESLGLELSVVPNFVTQECQWSFGERPVPVEDDVTFPRGCLVGCESRLAMAGRKGSDVLCM